MKNKKRIFRGPNRKQLKKIVMELKKDVISITKELENERATHKECKDSCVKYVNKNMDLVHAHAQEKQEWERKLQDKDAELTAAKYSNEKLVEQLNHFTEEVQYLEVEIAERSSRSLLQRIFNMGVKHEKFKAR